VLDTIQSSVVAEVAALSSFVLFKNFLVDKGEFEHLEGMIRPTIKVLDFGAAFDHLDTGLGGSGFVPRYELLRVESHFATSLRKLMHMLREAPGMAP